MQTRSKQRGMGMWGLFYVLGTLGFIVFVGLKIQPIYMNEMKIRSVMSSASKEGNFSSPDQMHRALQRRWDVEDITVLTTKEVRLGQGVSGKTMQYDYWNQVELFSGVYLSFNFIGDYPLGGGKY